MTCGPSGESDKGLLGRIWNTRLPCGGRVQRGSFASSVRARPRSGAMHRAAPRSMHLEQAERFADAGRGDVCGCRARAPLHVRGFGRESEQASRIRYGRQTYRGQKGGGSEKVPGTFSSDFTSVFLCCRAVPGFRSCLFRRIEKGTRYLLQRCVLLVLGYASVHFGCGGRQCKRAAPGECAAQGACAGACACWLAHSTLARCCAAPSPEG